MRTDGRTDMTKLIVAFCQFCKRAQKGLTLILLTWKIWLTPNNASKWQMGLNLAFKGLKIPEIHYRRRRGQSRQSQPAGEKKKRLN